MNWTDVDFSDVRAGSARHHADAASGNAAVVREATSVMLTALANPGDEGITHILLKAAAGAGKSYALLSMIEAAAGAAGSRRIGVAAFTNNQIKPLAEKLTQALGRGRVCLHLSAKAADDLTPDFAQKVTVSTSASAIPATTDVLITTAHKLKAPGEKGRIRNRFGVAEDDPLYDVLFIDEAWQMPHHLFDPIGRLAPLVVGVGDVGQLPPLEAGGNPWRGDAGHNPYRAWPPAFEGRATTWARELPAVWRPAGESLDLWRAFYPEWGELNSVAAPGERSIRLTGPCPSEALWHQVGTGRPTLLEVEGLAASEAPDVDLPLTRQLESWLDDLFTAGFEVVSAEYDADGVPTGGVKVDRPRSGESGDPLVVVLATRNQAVDDATLMVERLRAKHGLGERDLLASTVDSWQGQTNAITIAFHPLTGAAELDEFNSAFGRLAVACTRATHGLLMLSRTGLDDLLAVAPARPGTPFGEPGVRQLPRQTHQRILAALSRGTIDVADDQNDEGDTVVEAD